MEKKILYHIGLYGFRKLIVYVIKDNGIIYLLLALTWNCNLHNINE